MRRVLFQSLMLLAGFYENRSPTRQYEKILVNLVSQSSQLDDSLTL